MFHQAIVLQVVVLFLFWGQRSAEESADNLKVETVIFHAAILLLLVIDFLITGIPF